RALSKEDKAGLLDRWSPDHRSREESAWPLKKLESKIFRPSQMVVQRFSGVRMTAAMGEYRNAS
ncbi:hypothetical protein, partial [Agrobacterium vitis]|uniref:hypothetical protein n=1 Tax=Agrobacterium vitis TaxID=373 RepID=UPI001AED43C1